MGVLSARTNPARRHAALQADRRQREQAAVRRTFPGDSSCGGFDRPMRKVLDWPGGQCDRRRLSQLAGPLLASARRGWACRAPERAPTRVALGAAGTPGCAGKTSAESARATQAVGQSTLDTGTNGSGELVALEASEPVGGLFSAFLRHRGDQALGGGHGRRDRVEHRVGVDRAHDEDVGVVRCRCRTASAFRPRSTPTVPGGCQRSPASSQPASCGTAGPWPP